MKEFKRFLLVFVIIFGLVGLIACKGKKNEPKPELEVYDMSGITFEDLEVDWDGKAKSILISGELPEGVTVSYEGNERVRVGTYEIKANFEGADTHQPIPSMTATLTIKETETSKLVDEIEVMLDTIFNLNAQKMFRIEDEKLLFDYHFLAAYSLSVETGFGFGFDIDERVGDSELFPFFHDQISVTSLKQAMDVIQIGRAYNRSLPRGVGDYIVEVTNPESVYNYAPILNVLRETGGNDVLKVNVLDKIPTVVTDNADLDPDTAAAILAASTGYEFETTHIVERIKLFATQDGILGFGDIASSTSTAQVMIGFLTAGISLDIVLEGGNVVNLYEVLKTFYDAELGGFKNQLAQVDLDFNFATPQAFAALACYRAHLITGEKVNLF